MAARLFGREVEPRSRESENDRMVRLGRGSLNLRSSFHVATVTGKETDGGDGPIPTRCKSGSLFTCGGLKLRKPLLPDPGTTQIEGMQRIAREKGGSLEIRRTRIAPLGGLPYPG